MILLALLAYIVVGALNLAVVDGNGRLLVWYQSSPYPLLNLLALLLWPVVLACWFYYRAQPEEP